MTVDDILDGILEREQQGAPPYLAHGDAGGRTSWGIAERFHPDAWRNGPPTREAARAILAAEYVRPFDSLAAAGCSERLREAVIDDGVLCGVVTAAKRLQAVIGVVIDGVIGPVTLQRLAFLDQVNLLKRYVVERAVRACRLVKRRPSDVANIEGWMVRILGFLP